MRITGFADDQVFFGPVTRAKAAVIELTNVPPSVNRIQIEYLADDSLVGIGTSPVILEPGRVTVLVDPDFLDVREGLVGLSVTPTQSSVAKGNSLQLTATGYLAGGDEVDLTSLASWSSSDGAVASVSSSGLVSGLDLGSASIAASLSGQSGAADVSVTAPAVVAVEIQPEDPLLALGLGATFTATAYYSDGTSLLLTDEAIWNSSETSVATVNSSSGEAESVAVGQTTISADFGGQSGSTTLTVGDAQLEELRIEPQDALSAPGTKRRYRAVGSYSDSTVRDLTSQVTWSTGDDTIATISNSDLGQGSIGQATVTGNSGQSVLIQASLGAESAQTTLNLGLFAYVANRDSDSLSEFAVDVSTGALTPTAQGTIDTGNDPIDLEIHPSGRFLFVINSGDDDVSTFAVDPATGALSLVGQPEQAGDEPSAVVVAPNGRYLYVTNYTSEDIVGYSIDQETGELSPFPGAPVSAGPSPIPATLDPTGRFLYVGNFVFPSLLSGFAIDSESGQLAPTDPATFDSPFLITAFPIDPSGRFLYAPDGSDVVGYVINQLTGALTQMTPLTPIGGTAVTMTVDPSGRFAFVPNSPTIGTYAISGFLIDSISGALTPTVQGQVGLSEMARGIFVEPGGRFLYTTADVETGTDQVFGFSVDQATGALTAAGSADTGEAPQAMTLTP